MTSVINLQYSEANDAGIYQCRASNPYGAASFNVHLTILGEYIEVRFLLIVFNIGFQLFESLVFLGDVWFILCSKMEVTLYRGTSGFKILD